MKKGYIKVSKGMLDDVSVLLDIIKTGKPTIKKTKEQLFDEWNSHPKEDLRNHFA